MNSPADPANCHGNLVTAMTEKLENLCSAFSDRTIYRVPQKIRSSNEEAYTPRVVAIGPFHHGNEKLKVIEELKWRYLKTFLEQCRSNIRLEECVQAAGGWEQTARHCYSEVILMSSAEFVEMLVLDAAFIIQLFLFEFDEKLADESDPIYRKPWMSVDVYRDICLLENQIPFFIIDGLFKIAFGDRQQGRAPSFLDLALKHFSYLGRMSEFLERTQTCMPKHVLDILWFGLLPSKRRKQQARYLFTKFAPTATVLNSAGVKFKARDSNCLIDVHFAKGKGVLEIPCVTLMNRSETLFRNLIAWEQCQYQDDSYITDYMFLMDSLINTAEDVDLLIRYGIIDSWLGDSGAVAELFNHACDRAVLWSGRFYFSETCNALNAHCNMRWQRWRATLMRDYFSNPWAVISVIVAAILILLTLIQSICSIIAL